MLVRLDNIGYWPAKVRYGVLVLCSVLVVSVVFFSVALPEQRQHAQLRQAEWLLQQHLQTQQAQIALMNTRTQSYAQQYAQIMAVKKSWQLNTSVPEVLSFFARAAQRSGAHLQRLTPGTVTEAAPYQQISIQLQLQGNFEQLHSWLTLVERAPLLLSLDALHWRSEKNTSASTPLLFDATLTYYFLATEQSTSLPVVLPEISPALERNPFARSQVAPLQQYALTQLHLVGIVIATPHSWALLQTPHGLQRAKIGDVVDATGDTLQRIEPNRITVHGRNGTVVFTLKA